MLKMYSLDAFVNTATRKSTRAPVSRDVNEDKKWGRFTSVVYAAMGSSS